MSKYPFKQKLLGLKSSCGLMKLTRRAVLRHVLVSEGRIIGISREVLCRRRRGSDCWWKCILISSSSLIGSG